MSGRTFSSSGLHTAQSTNESKQIYIAPYVASKSEVHSESEVNECTLVIDHGQVK